MFRRLLSFLALLLVSFFVVTVQAQTSDKISLTKTQLDSIVKAKVDSIAQAKLKAIVKAPTQKLDNIGVIEVIAQDSVLRVVYREETLTLKAYTPGLVSDIKSLNKGDQVLLQYSEEEPVRRLQSVAVKTHKLEITQRLFVLLGTALLLAIIAKLLLKKKEGAWFEKGLRSLMLGVDMRYSNSQFQIVVWFAVVMVSYVAVMFCRVWKGGAAFFGGVEIPQNLLLLSGLSALTFAAAKGIAKEKAEALLHEPKVKDAPKPPNPSLLYDLFHDDNGRIDTGDFQMVIVTFAAVFVYIGQIFNYLGAIELYSTVSLPDVDTTILASFGLGQGAYLAKKYVGEPPKSATDQDKQEATGSPAAGGQIASQATPVTPVTR